MRDISVKALLVSNAAYFVVVFVTLCLGTAAAMLAIMASRPDISATAAAAIVDSSGLNISVIFFSSGIAAATAGYIAGRIAKQNYVLNGVMAISFLIVFTLGLDTYELAFGPLFETPNGLTVWQLKLFEVVILICAAVVSIFGAHLARLQQSRWDAMSAEERAANGYKAVAVSIFRWPLALAVGMAVYAGFLKLVPLAFGHTPLTVVFAVAFAIMFATFVIPAAQRKNACLLFAAIAIVLPAEEFFRHSFLGMMKSADGIILLLNTLGALLAYAFLRRAFRRANAPRVVPQVTTG